MKLKKIVSRMLVGVALVGLLAGCGAGGNSNQADTANQETQGEGQRQGEGEYEENADAPEAGNADAPEAGEAGSADAPEAGDAENADAPDTEAAGNGDAEDESQPADSDASSGQAVQGENGNTGSGTLIAYFSIPEDVDTAGVDAIAGASIVVKDSEVMGNTEYVAKLVQETIGGDLFRIETVEEYPLDHEPLVDQAAEEQDVSLRPELASHIENLDQYDTIILGYPNWWGDFPMPLYSFLEEYDFSGKTIIPFVTHGGSGFSDTKNTISELQPNAVVGGNTLSLSRNGVSDSAQEVRQWAESLGI